MSNRNSITTFTLAIALVAAVTAGSASFACAPPGSACSDGNACTFNDICNAAGVCVGTIPDPIRYCTTGTSTIPSVGTATPYPSTLPIVAGPTLCGVSRFIFQGITHTNPDDLDIMLVGPQGQNAKIMSDVGGSADLNNLPLMLLDSAGSPIPDGGPLFGEGNDAPLGGGPYRPTDVNDGVDTFPAPAPAPSGGSALSVFNGTNPNGTWKLFVVDDRSGDSGSLAPWCVYLSFLCTADAQCNDGDTCTIDSCGKDGQCIHFYPEPEPPEAQGLRIASNKQSITWSPLASAVHYDVVRGAIASLPMGPGDGDEFCFNDVAGTSIVDATLPAPGTAYWYLVRGDNCYGTGTYGTRSNAFPRNTSTCQEF